MRQYMDVEQERQKTYCDCSMYGSSYKVGEEVLVFNTTVKGRNKKFFSSCRGPYIIVEITNDLNLRVEDKKKRKTFKVHMTNQKNIKHEKGH